MLISLWVSLSSCVQVFLCTLSARRHCIVFVLMSIWFLNSLWYLLHIVFLISDGAGAVGGVEKLTLPVFVCLCHKCTICFCIMKWYVGPHINCHTMLYYSSLFNLHDKLEREFSFKHGVRCNQWNAVRGAQCERMEHMVSVILRQL